MKIEQIQLTKLSSRRRVSARITWEDCERPQQEIFFEVDEQFGDALSPDADSFVTAAVMPALWHGERRIALDAELCPEPTILGL